MPVTYSAVLSIVPNLHARPPTLPSYGTVIDPGLPPPVDGYDFILHVGLGGRGGLSIEKRARKEGYNFKDVDGQLAPVISNSPSPVNDGPPKVSEAVSREQERLNGDSQGPPSDGSNKPVRRGFGDDYKDFPAELWSCLNVDGMINHLKSHGSEVRSSFISTVFFIFSRLALSPCKTNFLMA